MNGQVKVGAISGSFLYDLALRISWCGTPAARCSPTCRACGSAYRLPNLIAGQVVLASVQLDRPTIQLIKHRNGRMNYEEVLGLGKGTGGGTSPLIDFHNVRVDGGTLRIALPWNPDRLAPDRRRRATPRSRPSGPSPGG